MTSGSVVGRRTTSFAATTTAAAPSENGQQSYRRRGEAINGNARYVSIVISFWKWACGFRAALAWFLIAIDPNISGVVRNALRYTFARVA